MFERNEQQPDLRDVPDTSRVKRGFEALSHLLVRPEVRQEATRFRKTLEAEAEKLEIVTDYKDLHDELHVLALDLETIVFAANRFPTDERAYPTLEAHNEKLGILAESLQELLFRRSFRQGEIPQILFELTTARDQMEEAIGRGEARGLQRGLWHLRRILLRYPTAANELLRRAADDLDFGPMAAALREMLPLLNAPTSDDVRVLDESIAALGQLDAQLRQLVHEHDVWQQVSDDFRVLEQATDWMEALEAVWPDVKRRGEPIWSIGGEPWREKMRCASRDLEASLSGDPSLARRCYRSLYGKVRARFYQVDAALKMFCEHLREVQEPLNGAIRQLLLVEVEAAPGEPSPEVVEALLQLVRRTPELSEYGELIALAYQKSHEHPQLRAAALEAAASSHPAPQLEACILPFLAFDNVAEWRAAMERVERTICRIETPTLFGTGFLVGRDLVLTNEHVVRAVAADPRSHEKVRVRFGYRTDVDGLPGGEDRLCRVAKTWLIASSPARELDYALIRLAEAPGEDETRAGVKRGWIELPAEARDITEGEALLILQHPRGAPLKISGGAVTGRQVSPNRVLYTSNTLGGSSGAPCFDMNWMVVALHHAGDAATANFGIPLSAIVPELSRELWT